MKQRLFKVLCLFLLPALLLTGCFQETPAEEDGIVLTEQLEQPPEETGPILPEQFSLPYVSGLTLDPVTCGDGMQQVVASLLCEGLFRLGPDFQPALWLCESFLCDGTKYTFHLRDGVVFSDGSPLTAKDVKTTLERARSSARYGRRLSGVTRITAKDQTVTVTLSAPNNGFPALLDIPIVKAGTEKTVPIGTGPYLFSAESTGDCLIANQTWWRNGNQPLERIALVEASDQDTMLYRFNSHDVQLITVDLTGSAAISTTGSMVHLDANTSVLQYIGCNTTRAPLDDPALRSRLWRSIDRNQVVNAMLSGHGTAAQFPISPASPLYPSDLERAELAAVPESGDPIRPLVLLVNEENRFKVSAARRIAADFTAAGIPVDINVLPWDVYTDALSKGDFDLYYGEVRLTADWNLSALLGTGGSLNYGHWTDAQTDRLLADFAVAEDRAAAARALCLHLRDQAPILPVCFKASSTLVQTGVLDGLISTAGEPFYNLSDCTVHLREP